LPIVADTDKNASTHWEDVVFKDAQLATALNNMAQGLSMFDREKRLVLCNSRYLEMYELSADVVKPGSTLRALLARCKEAGSFLGDIDEYCANLDTAIASGETTSTVQNTADGRMIHTIARPRADGGWVETHEDVTERKRFEERLRQAQKMEMIGNLAGALAHDFNNLLTVIIGNLDALQELTDENPEQKKPVELVLEASFRGAELTRQLLAFSGRQPLHPKVTNLGDLIEKTSRLLMRTLGENIRLDVQTGADLGSILIDEAQMQAALINMAVNSRDAMPNGGTLTIKANKAHITSRETHRPPGLTSGQYAVIEINDSGCGMPPDVVARMFEPFFTTKARGRGTGLGLSMVYGFVRRSGGYISAESEVGNGTTLKLYFPCSAIGEARARAGAQDANPAARTGLILAVDDDAAVLATAVLQLEALGYQTLTAQNAQEALQVLDRHVQVDVLFTDIMMPGAMNGRELAKLARIKRPGLRVVYTSALPGTESTAGTDGDLDAPLIAKPYRKNDLARTLDQIFNPPEIAPAPGVDTGARSDRLASGAWHQ
jgi:signal transduction histidine kinase/CheY-like chemotaxis protein